MINRYDNKTLIRRIRLLELLRKMIYEKYDCKIVNVLKLDESQSFIIGADNIINIELNSLNNNQLITLYCFYKKFTDKLLNDNQN